MSKLIAILAAATLMVAGAVVGGDLVSAGSDDEVQQVTVDPAAPAVEDEGPGTDVVPGEPRYGCRELYDRQVCDTFGESDEGPGTR